MASPDPFYQRSEAFVTFANSFLHKARDMEVAASAAHAAARYSAWAIANASASADEVRAKKDEAIGKFLNGYRLFLEQNFEDYIAHFDQYYPGRAANSNTPEG